VDILLMIVKVVIFVVLGLVLVLPLYAVPATLSLPSGLRPGIEALTLDEAARQLQASGKTGADLVEAARALVAERMNYSRRNSFDSPSKAFERGYGYCTQQAYALVGLLTRLGVESDVVHAFRNRFPDGSVGGHAWVRVTVDGEARTIDSIHYNAETGELTFIPLSKVLDHTPLFKLVTGWGEAAVNAHRYYRTGKDW
jgi:transglutaminase-like putative cysteine protease